MNALSLQEIQKKIFCRESRGRDVDRMIKRIPCFLGSQDPVHGQENA